MASEVGSLAVRVGADVTDYRRGMKDASISTDDFANRIRGGITDVAKFGAAITAAGVAIAAALVKKQMEAIDAQAKLAQQMRTSVDSIGRLTRAGDLAGVSIQQIGTAGRKLDVVLGQAIQGVGASADAFKRLGLDAEVVSKMPLDERIQTINEALRENVPAAERAAVAADIFGTKAAAAMQMLDPDTMARARKETEALGTAISDIDAAKVEAANDAMSGISEVLRGIVNRVAVKLAPVLEALANMFVNNAIEAQGFKDVIETAFEAAIKGAMFTADALNGLEVAAKAGQLLFQELGNAAIQVFSEIVRGYIEIANLIPGIDVNFDDTFFGRLAKRSSESVQQTRQELHDMANEPLPSAALEQFLKDVEVASTEAAKRTVEARKIMLDEGPESEEAKDEKAEKELERLREQLAARVETIRESFLTEQEAENEHHTARLDDIQAAYDQEILTMQERDKLKESEEKRHMDALAKIRKAGMTSIEKFTAMSYQEQAKTIFGELASITAGVSRESRTMFNINKAAGIANAIINTYQGISKTLATYPWPISGVMAAAHAAAGFAQVNAIRSQSFSGGGTGAAPSLAGATAAPPVSDVGMDGTSGQSSGGQPGSQRTFIIQGISEGSLFSGSALRSLLEQIEEAAGDGRTRIVVA